MKIALIQQKAGKDKYKNLEKGIAAVEEASGNEAQIAVFAELAFEPFYPQHPAEADKIKLAETLEGPITKQLCEIAARNKIVIIPNFFEKDGSRTFDTSPVIDADGKVLGKIQMNHIPDYENFHERTYYTPGKQGAKVFDTAYGKIGVAICYDRHFPEYMRALGLAGAELVVTPQAGAVGEWTEGLYEAEMQIAAFQNGYFTALCNRVGVEENLNFAGASFVCAPDGRLLAQAKTGTEEILYCDIDLTEIRNSHAKKLFYPDRRPDLYQDWI
ncbi:MAG: carbon-nitrogen hydrolase family protein [Bacteroidales bacterium]|nr:carbon-nitrogen hydrolase family protein [Bacteroidales bacterium]